MTSNVDKTNYILFSCKNEKLDYEIKLSNIRINKTFSTKFLGVHIDHKLSCKDYISNVCKKVSKCIAIINKARYVLGKDSLSFLYTSIIEPHLTYCVDL